MMEIRPIFRYSIGRSLFTAVSSAPIGMLLPNESVEMMISYTPINLEDTGWLKVTSDDPAAQTVYVELMGTGLFRF